MRPVVSPVAVEMHGWTWGSGLLTILNILVGGLLVAVVRTRPQLKKIANERESNLLAERAEEMTAMRERLERLETERAIDRHRLNNVTACLDSLLLLLETSPEKASAHVARIKEMRAQQMLAESAEKGAMLAAVVKKGSDA